MNFPPTTAPRRILRAIAALIRTTASGLGAAAILAGLPYLLATRIGWPLPRRWMGVHTLVTDLTTRSLNTNAVFDALAIILWICWAILVLGAVSEVGAAILRRPAPQIPGLRPGQVLAAALIALIGVSLLRPTAPATGHRTLPGPVHPTGSLTTNAALPTPAPSRAKQRVATSALTNARPESLESTTVADSTAGSSEEVTVVSGQTLFGIAEQATGSGQNWPTLFKLNADRAEPDGAHFTDPNLIRPGWRIEVPLEKFTSPATTKATASTAGSGQPVAPTPTTGPASALPLATSTSHPETLAPHTPAGSSATAARPAAPPAPNTTQTPATGPEGTASASAHGARRHGGAAVSLPDGGAIGITLAVALGSALVLARRWRTRRADPRYPQLEPELPGALLAARRAHLATASQDPAAEDHDEITASAGDQTKSGFDASGHKSGEESADGEHRGVQESADEESDAYFDPESALGASEYALEGDGRFELGPSSGNAGPVPVVFAAPLPSGSITTAERDGVEIPLRPASAGLGLIGPGATGAARAIAASVLSAGSPDRTSDLARLIIPAADLAMLLGLDAADLPAAAAAVPELYVVDDLAAAVAEAEVNALLRTRLLEETDAADLDEMAREHPDVEECPPLVVMASPQRAETGRIGALIDQSTPLRITTVLLGPHPGSATVYVDADGHAEGSDLAEWTGARMFNLSAADLNNILDLLAAAAGHPPTPAQATRPDLTLVQTDQLPETDEPDATAGQATILASARPHSAGNDDPQPEPAREPTDGPRLVLVDDPAETRAEQMLAAWEQRPVRISVLGPLRIEADGESVTKLRSQARPIAALLAWKNAAGASDQQIDTTCWPDEDDPARIQQWRQDGLKSLRSRLRTATGRKTAQFVALRDRRDYVLEPDFATVDLWVLQALEQAASASRDPKAKLRHLTRAAEFCAGELLAEETGADFAWADGPRVSVTGLQVSVLARLAELAADDEPDKALAALRRAAAMAEDNEHLHLRIIDLLAALGRHTEIPAQMQILTAHADSMGASVSQAARAHAARALRTADARP